jgi:hypothetical protein
MDYGRFNSTNDIYGKLTKTDKARFREAKNRGAVHSSGLAYTVDKDYVRHVKGGATGG